MIKQIPKNENICVTYKCQSNVYVITKHLLKGNYTLYKKVKEGYERLGTGSNPIKLEEKYIKR